MNDIMTQICTGGVFVIAEAGVNHNGDFDTAIKLIDAAAEAGADAVKFQTYDADELAAPGRHHTMLKALQIPLSWYVPLKQHAKKRKIEFMSSAFDIGSARFLDDLGVEVLKIPSGELTNLQFLGALPELGIPLIVSTGMATKHEMLNARMALNGADVIWLHCVSAYPADPDDYNLNNMTLLGSFYGLSDHTKDDLLAVAAVAMGASVIERHITLDCGMPGPDHEMSTDPASFKTLVDAIRRVDRMMGSESCHPTDAEKLVMPRARRTHGPHGFKRYA